MVHIDERGSLKEIGGSYVDLGSDITKLLVSVCADFSAEGGDIRAYVATILITAIEVSLGEEVRQGIMEGIELAYKRMGEKFDYSVPPDEEDEDMKVLSKKIGYGSLTS